MLLSAIPECFQNKKHKHKAIKWTTGYGPFFCNIIWSQPKVCLAKVQMAFIANKIQPFGIWYNVSMKLKSSFLINLFYSQKWKKIQCSKGFNVLQGQILNAKPVIHFFVILLINLFIWMITYPTAQLHVSASNRMVRKQQKMLSFSSGRKTPTEEKPTQSGRNWKPILHAKSEVRLEPGSTEVKGRERVTEPTSSPCVTQGRPYKTVSMFVN